MCLVVYSLLFTVQFQVSVYGAYTFQFQGECSGLEMNIGLKLKSVASKPYTLNPKPNI